jgi:hypothetical protein
MKPKEIMLDTLHRFSHIAHLKQRKVLDAFDYFKIVASEVLFETTLIFNAFLLISVLADSHTLVMIIGARSTYVCVGSAE